MVTAFSQIHFLVRVWGEFVSVCVEFCYLFFYTLDSFQLPVLEGQPNVTALDLQLKNLRDAAVDSITQMAVRMREEATDVKATVGDIEDWLDRIKQLAEEVRKKKAIPWFACSSAFFL